jgi:F-type H+-transporting ATPase subunit b
MLSLRAANAAQVLLAAEAEEHGSPVDLLLPAWPELVAGIIAFAIVFLFVRMWAWPAITRSLEARQKAITGQLAEAEKAKAEAESLRADYEKQIAGAKGQGNQIIDEARKTAEQMKGDILDRAQAEADGLVAKAREEADGEKARALIEARQEVANLSIDLAEKVVGKNLDREAQLGLVEQYIAELERK